MSEFCVDIRNLTKYTFVNIIHTNRSQADVQALKFAGAEIYPGPEQIKESGRKIMKIMLPF